MAFNNPSIYEGPEPGPLPPEGGGGPIDPGGGGGGCAPGTFEIDIDANGKPFPAGTPRECVDQAEASRRNKIWVQLNPGNPAEGAGGGGGGGTNYKPPSGPAKFNFEPLPEFNAPQFQWSEQFRAPSEQEALQDPGYKFRLGQGLGAIENSAASRGAARTGGHLKDLSGWAQNFASQEYGNVFNRALQGYDTRFNTAKDKFMFEYTGAKDMFAPKLLGWQTRSAFGSQAAIEAWRRAWDDYWRNTLSASEIYGSGQS